MSGGHLNHLTLKKLILFNSKWGQTEGTEKEKLIYSSSTPLFTSCRSSTSGDNSTIGSAEGSRTSQTIEEEERDDLKQVSLCEASIAFVNLFGSHKGSPSESEEPICIKGHSGTMIVFRKIEKPSFWFVAVLTPDASISNCDNYMTPEYHTIYQLLGSLYSCFVRQNGTLKHVSCDANTSITARTRMRKVCQLFFEWTLPHAANQMGISLPPITPSNIFGGRSEGLMKFMSLDRGSFLSIQSFTHHITYSYSMTPGISTLFLYNDQLINSSLCLSATRLLYSYATSQILPEAVCEEMSWSKKRESSSTYWLYDRKPLLIFLPENDDSDSDTHGDLVRDWKKCDLYAYRSLNGATVLIIMSSLDPTSVGTKLETERKSLLDSIDLYAKQNLYQLTVTLSKAIVQKPSAQFSDHQIFPTNFDVGSESTGLSFMYYNEANAALKTSASVCGMMHRQVSSASLQGLHHSSSSPLIPSSLVQNSDPFNSWISLEADLRTLILPSALVENQNQKLNAKGKSTEGSLEILAKTESEDHWVIFKRGDARVLFATLSAHKNLNLEEVASMCNSRWSNFGVPSAAILKDMRISTGGQSASSSSSHSTPQPSAGFLPFSALFQ